MPGGRYVHALEADPLGCLDPAQQRYHVALNITRQLSDSLVDQDPETGEIVPWLAKSWDVSTDATTFTFHLVDGATFSDGAPIDAAAVKANFDRIAALGPKAIGAVRLVRGLRRHRGGRPEYGEGHLRQGQRAVPAGGG